MIITAKDLAEYFRRAVSFDFDRETILSYDQIRRNRDAFYTLENERAFVALLHDLVGFDDQLVDVFQDLNSVGRGLRYFAEERNRQNAFIAVSHLLNDERYSYHKTEIARVHLAINTWLCFFGAQEIPATFEKCPICASAVKGGACVNLKCRKKETDFVSILCELQDILTREERGEATALPKYYKLISQDAEFGQFKVKIDAIREKREAAEKEEDNKKIKKAIKEAERELEKLNEKLKVELAKENPDLDSILQELKENSKIVKALGYDEKSFDSKVEALMNEIQSAKNSLNSRKEAQAYKQEAIDSFKEFSNKKSALDMELSSSAVALPREQLKQMLDSANESYQAVISVNARFPGIYSQSEQDIIASYESTTRPSVEKRIKESIEEEILDKAKDTLVATIGEVERRIVVCQSLGDGANDVLDYYTKEVEQNKAFIDCRENPKWEKIYKDITTPVKTKIDTLVNDESRQKKKALKDKITPLKDRVKAAKPKDKLAYSLEAEYNEISKDSYFNSIKSSAEYKKEMTSLRRQITQLVNEQKKYFKKKRLIIILSVSLTVIIGVFLYSLFAYILPISEIKLEASQTGTDRCAVTGFKDEEADTLDIPEYLPHYFLQQSLKITAIAENAFNGSTQLKKCVIPQTVEQIGEGAFANCESLKTVELKSNEPPKVGKTTFDNTSAVILVPQESYYAYLQHKDWKKYSAIIFPNYNNEDGKGTVMFDVNGAEAIEPLKNVPLNVSIELPVPTREGYEFVYWYYVDEQGVEVVLENDNATFARSTKIIAKWKPAEYTVTFDYNDGESESVTIKVTNGWPWINYLLTVSPRTGYIFDGWHLNDQRLTDNTEVWLTADATIYAKWIPN